LPLTIRSNRFYWSATWSMTLLTAIAIAGFVRLGVWQWQRAQLKTAQQAQFDAGAQRVTPVDAANAGTLPRYATVLAGGHYDSSHQFLLENISRHGLPGYEVLTPFALADGHLLMVNRGWIQASGPRSQLPDVALSADGAAAAAAPTTVTGRLDDLPVVGISLGHIAPPAGAQWPKLTAFPTMADLSAALGAPLPSRQLLLDPGEPNGYLREWQVSGIGPGRNLSYAVQWWSFATLALVLYAWLNWRRQCT
jgi:surfeit locus 1 family protein